MLDSYFSQMSSYEPMKLCRIGAILCLFTFGLQLRSTTWNFPIFLFGIIAHEMSGFVVWQHFVNILYHSLFLDVFNLLFGSVDFLGFILVAITIALKITLYHSAKRALTEKGGQLVDSIMQGLDIRNVFHWNAGGQRLGGDEPQYTQGGQPAPSYNQQQFPGSGFTLGTDDGPGHVPGGARPGPGGYQPIS